MEYVRYIAYMNAFGTYMCICVYACNNNTARTYSHTHSHTHTLGVCNAIPMTTTTSRDTLVLLFLSRGHRLSHVT